VYSNVDSSALWRQFREAFAKEVVQCDISEFEAAWKGRNERTDFYSEKLLPRTAKALNLDLVHLRWNVDYAMCIPSSTAYSLPLIFIESENDWRVAIDEVRKLACLAAPLNILMTIAEWDTTPDAWQRGGQKTKLLAEWQEVARQHSTVWPSRAFLGIIVGEWQEQKKRLRFYTYGISPTGSSSNACAETIIEISAKPEFANP
jgi:hypothetical protein